MTPYCGGEQRAGTVICREGACGKVTGGEVVVDEEQALAISKVIAPDSDIRVELGVPPNAEVHFIGRPILALDPRFNNGTVPARFLHHPLVEGRYLFALPRPLWDSVYSKIGQDAFDAEAVELELKLSDMCGDFSFNVGLWQGGVFTYSLLRESPLDLSSAECAATLKKNKVQLEHLAQAYEDRVKVFHRITRAYVGWLLTNGDFLDEHDALLSEWSQMVQRWGLSRLGTPAMTGMFLPGDDPAADPSWPGYKAAFNEFFTRWRLLGLAAPYLPIPLQPLMAGSVPLSAVSQLNNSGGAFCMPDTFPVPSRDTLRNLLDDALHGTAPPNHLTEWMKLISRGNAAKKPFLKFARLLEIQHYWRVLHHRHPIAIRRKLRLLKEAIASFLEVTWDTVHRDLFWIRRRLGSDWTSRGQGFPTGPF